MDNEKAPICQKRITVVNIYQFSVEKVTVNYDYDGKVKGLIVHHYRSGDCSPVEINTYVKE